jgi:hypothetical protein
VALASTVGSAQTLGRTTASPSPSNQWEEKYMSEPHSYESVREKWVHEDNLMHHRLTWLIQAQGLLFTAYAVFLQVPNGSQWFTKAQKLVDALPIFGFAVTLFIGLAIGAAYSAQQQLIREQLSKPEAQRFVLNVGGGLTFLGYFPPFVFPALFLLTWLYIKAA